MRKRFSRFLQRAMAIPQSMAAVCLAPNARAADFVVGVQELDYFPMYATNANGQYVGYARELLDLFASHSAHRFVYRVLPVKRLVHDDFLGRVDFMFPDNPRWDTEAKRALRVRYAAPAITFQDAVMVLPDRKGQPLQSLGTVRGGMLTLVEATGPQNLIHMALARRVDGINVARQVAEFHLMDLGRPSALVVDATRLPSTDSQNLLSSIQHPEVIISFDQFLHTHQTAVTALKQKYGL